MQARRVSSLVLGGILIKTMANAIEACEAGCSDERDEKSCTALEGIIGTICGVSPDICSNLCAVEGDKRYKKIACEKAGATP